jgi:hypothetical protein
MITSFGNSRLAITTSVAALLIFVATANAALFGKNYNDHALTLAPEKSRTEGEWRAGVDVLKRNRGSGINIEIREDRSTYGFYLPTERAPRIEGKTSDGSTLHFVIEAESGDLEFDGVVKNKVASGRYVFEPNKEYAAEAGKLLRAEPTNDELLKLAFARVSLGYIKGIHEALPSSNLDDMVRLRHHGLDPDGVKAFVAAGFARVEEITRLRNHGVTPEYATKARAAGYGKSAEEITRLRNFGVTPEYLTGWKEAGFALSADEIVKLRNFGVQPEYGAAWKKAGYDIDPEGLVRARNFGVPIEFAAALGGDKKPSLDEVVRMRQFGINADFYRDIKGVKPDYSVEEIIRLRQFGVSSDYMKAICATRNDFTAEQIVKLRSFGVPAEYVAALNVPDRKPLDAQAIIDLRSRGVSAETARKLRE